MIFNELEEAEKILKNKELDYFGVKSLSTVAKYFRYIGQSWDEVKNSLIEYCNSQKLIKFESRNLSVIERAITNAKKHNLRIPTMCCITKQELEEIESLNDFKTERIFFVMICLAKYFMETNTNVSKKKYDEIKLQFWKTTGELFREARYSNNFFDRNILIGEIEDKKYIKTKSTNDMTKNYIEIYTFYSDSEPIIFFTNPDKIYKLYKAYRDNQLTICEDCGISIVKSSSRSPVKYCEKCAYKRRLESNNFSRMMKNMDED